MRWAIQLSGASKSDDIALNLVRFTLGTLLGRKMIKRYMQESHMESRANYLSIIHSCIAVTRAIM